MKRRWLAILQLVQNLMILGRKEKRKSPMPEEKIDLTFVTDAEMFDELKKRFRVNYQFEV